MTGRAKKPDNARVEIPTTVAELVLTLRQGVAGTVDLFTTDRDDRLEQLSATEFMRSIHSLVLALDDAGVSSGDRIAVLSANRPEWLMIDLACQVLGAVTVAIHPATPADGVAFILRNSESRWLFYDTSLTADAARVLLETTTLERCIAIDRQAAAGDDPTLTRLLGSGATRLGEVPLERFRGRVGVDDLSTLVYTAGATAEPKSTTLSQRQMMAHVQACASSLPMTGDDLAASTLPLSSLLQRTIDYLCLLLGAKVYYPASALGTALASGPTPRPTLMVASASTYSRIYRSIWRHQARTSGSAQRLFGWAVTVGLRHAEAGRGGFVGPILATQRALAKRWIYRRLLDTFGGRVRIALATGGPLADEVESFFDAIGLPIYVSYGVAEAAPLLAVGGPDDRRPGSVGRPVAGIELEIASDGEILVRGMETEDWLPTGDIGRLDRHGYLYVEGRKGDLITLTDGTVVAPALIESQLEARPGVARALVVGDGREQLAALLWPEPDPASDNPSQGDGAQPLADAISHLNRARPAAEQLRSWRPSREPLSVELGELTPSGKIRRRATASRRAREIAKLYASEAYSNPVQPR